MSHVHLLITGEAGHGKDTIANYLTDALGYKSIAFADLQKQEVISAYAGSTPPVTLEWLATRETKETPAERLSLKYCGDPNYVEVALQTFYEEDLLLFTLLQANDIAGLAESNWKNLSLSQQHFIRENLKFNEADRLELPRSPRRITQVWGTEYRRESKYGHSMYWIDPVDATVDKSADPINVTDGRTFDEINWGKEAGLQRIHVVRPDLKKKVANHVTEMIPEPDADTLIVINDMGLLHLKKKVEEEIIPFINSLSAAPRRKHSP